MGVYYADSSVLVVRERGTAWVRALMSPASGNLIITARVSAIEVYSALNRLVREQRLSLQDYDQLQGDFAAVLVAEYEWVELSPFVEDRARVLLETHPLWAYDAVQLASALFAHATLVAQGVSSMHFLSADIRLLAAARSEGLQVDNPDDHG